MYMRQVMMATKEGCTKDGKKYIEQFRVCLSLQTFCQFPSYPQRQGSNCLLGPPVKRNDLETFALHEDTTTPAQSSLCVAAERQKIGVTAEQKGEKGGNRGLFAS